MSRYKCILMVCIITIALFAPVHQLYAQCFTNYTLSPNGYQCGSSVTVTMSGSQAGVSYQLQGGGVNIGGVKIGTGSALNMGSATPAQQGTYVVVALANGSCSQQVVAYTTIYFNPTPGGTVTASNTIVCSNNPVTFTAQPTVAGNYSYQWFNNGPPVSGATSQTYTTSVAGNYAVLITNSCGSSYIACPALTAGATPGSPGAVTGPVSISLPVAASTYNITTAANANSYSWSVSNPAAGIITGNGLSATMKWNTAFSGNVIINATAVGNCGSTPATGLTVNVLPVTSAAGAECSAFNLSLANNQSYILTTTPKVPLTSLADLASPGTCDMMKTIEYFDGLGRPLQTIQIKGSPQLNDMVQPYAYDAMGRLANTYLAYSSTVNNGSYKADALTANAGQAQFYATPPSGSGVSGIDKPYAVIGFETSPLSRTVEHGAPGSAWQLPGLGSSISGGHTVRTDYSTNDQTSVFSGTYTAGTPNPGSKIVALYTATLNTTDQSHTLARLNNNATYPAGKLSLTITRDENWQPTDGCIGTMETYKDFDGNVILRRTYNLKVIGTTSTVEMLSTYYVYDNLHLLAFVLTPGANPDDNAVIAQSTLDNVCYQYQYDIRNRIIQKRIPGKDWEYTVYNTIDKPIATQDGNQRLKNQWIFNKYDALGRVIMTGIWDNNNTAITRVQLQGNVNGSGALWETTSTTGNGYSASAWPQNYITATLVLNYYDIYTGIPNFPAGFTAPSDALVNTTGLNTASLVNVLGKTDMLWTVHYYDNLGREATTYKQHYYNGAVNVNNYDKIVTTYNFNNQPTTVTREHHNSSSPVKLFTIANRYIYDQLGRKVKTWQQITNGTNTADTRVLLYRLKYNEIGQLWTKGIHSTDSLSYAQTVTNAYNERGWLLSSSSLLFTEQLQYNVVNGISGISPAAQFNGNIASQSWTTSTAAIKSYTYAYDRLNRLINGISTVNNSEQGIVYDKLGNITALQRTGQVTDNLVYTYKNGGISSQVNTIVDNSGSSTGMANGTTTYNNFDANGNCAYDGRNATAVTYNILNLPESYTAKGISYIYDATGHKLRRINGSNVTEYLDGIEYDGGAFSFIQTEEGRALPNGALNYNYEYNIKDHLGNSRITFDTPNNIARVKQDDDYYPFGLDVKNSTIPNPENKFLYNGKEMQDNLTQYDYGARFYDPVIARWTSVDPLAEKSRRWSPYNFTENNPIRNTDPDGMSTESWMQANGLNSNDLINLYTAPNNPAANDSKEDGEDPNQKVSRDPGQQIANSALNALYNNTHDWDYNRVKDNYGKGVDKCNKFVYDILKSVGINIGTPNGLRGFLGLPGGYPPSAGQWADANFNIPNWRVLGPNEEPKAGDVVAQKIGYQHATGHVGIVIGTCQTVSQADVPGVGEMLDISSFGFRPDNFTGIGQTSKCVFRRYEPGYNKGMEIRNAQDPGIGNAP